MKALIVVDMQNDFVNPQGALYVEGAEDIIRPIDEISEKYPLIVFTRDWHTTDDPSFKAFGGIWPMHCVRGTWGSWIHPRVMCQDHADMILNKSGYSAFFTRPLEPTGLFEYLRAHWVDQLTIAGVALDYCVKETALDAVRLGFGVSIDVRATRSVNPANDSATFDALRREGIGLS